jgi:mono/diheme cytochrome c family protein
MKNPKTVKPQSRMPPFDGKISDDDLKAVAEYLATLK